MDYKQTCDHGCLPISVAICTHNGAAFLKEQLESIVAQSCLPDEIVASDDASDDGTQAILQTFSSRYPGLFRIYRNPVCLGVAAHFMTTIRRCRNELVMLADQDDIWFKDRIAQFARQYHNNPKAMIYLSNGLLLQNGKVRGTLWRMHHFNSIEQEKVRCGQALTVMQKHVFVTGSAMMVKRSLLDQMPVPRRFFYHDEWLGWIAGNRIDLVCKPTYYYRLHDSQTVGQKRSILKRWLRYLSRDVPGKITLDDALLKYSDLRSALASGDEYAGQIQALNDKIRFIQCRRQLPQNRSARLSQMIGKIGMKEYTMNSRGVSCFLLDLIHVRYL